MKAVQISRAHGPWEVVERPTPEPGSGHVRVRVEACGICHSDVVVKEGFWPGITYPRVPGHEVAGSVDAVGPGVTLWKIGQRVGVGWHGGHCFECDACRRGDFMLCAKEKITAVHFDGGYSEFMVAPSEAVAAMTFNATAMINQRQSLAAWASGTAKDSEDAMRFAAMTGVRPMIETFPFVKAAEAFDKMMSGKVRFRAVLVMSSPH